MKRNITSYYANETKTNTEYGRTKILSSNLSLLPQIMTQHLTFP